MDPGDMVKIETALRRRPGQTVRLKLFDARPEPHGSEAEFLCTSDELVEVFAAAIAARAAPAPPPRG